MNYLWIVEGKAGSAHASHTCPVGTWVPLWRAMQSAIHPTKADCTEYLRSQKETTEFYKSNETYTEFRVAKYMREE